MNELDLKKTVYADDLIMVIYGNEDQIQED